MKKLITLVCGMLCMFAWARTMMSPTAATKPAKESKVKAAITRGTDFQTIWVLGELGIPQEDGTENQIGYRPDLGIKMNTADGIVYTATVHFFNIAGDPVHNFGFCAKEDLASGPGDWDYINNDRIGAAEPETTVNFGQPMKIGERAVSKENFFKIATGTYLVTLNMEENTMTATPTTDYLHLYIMGSGVKGQANAANQGTEFMTADGKNFKKQVTFESTDGANATFTFSTKLAADANDWEAIADKRFGATDANTPVVLNKEIAFGDMGTSKDNGFTIPAGTYEMSVNMETMTMKVIPQQFPPLYVMGRIAGQVWAANQGTAMETKDGNIYTLQAVFQKAEDRNRATFGFTTKLAGGSDWNQIADYRIGYTESYGNDGYPVPFGKKITLGKQGKASKENFLGVPDGEYKITVNLAENTCVVEPVGQIYDRLYVMGNTVTVDAQGNKKYQVWAADQGTELYTHDFNTYTGRVTFEDDQANATVTFGFTTKLGADFTKWDDIAASRFGAQANNTDVILDTDMQCGDYLASKENFFRIATGTYDVTVDLTTRKLRISKVPFTPVYVLGRIAYEKEGALYNQPWSPRQGQQLQTEDGNTYTGLINVEDDLGNAYLTIGFSTKLSLNEGDWDGIANNRFAAMTEGGEYLPFNTETQCGDFLVSKENHFKVRRGSYNIIVNLPQRTVKIVPTTDPVIYVIGTIEGKNFVANEGVALPTGDGKTYSGKVTFSGDDAQFVLSDKLAASEEAWNEIEHYTFGPETDQTPIAENEATKFGAYANAWTVIPKTYNITVDLVNMSILLTDPNTSGISTAESGNGITVYPTFTNGEVTVKGRQALGTVDVYNVSGKLVYHKAGINEKQIAIDLSNRPAGIYFLKVNAGKAVKVVKR